MKTWVMIPTYNEKENIRNLINAILNLNIPNLDIVIIDDDSPDGTSKVVENVAKKKSSVHLLLRTRNRGRGSAGIDGFRYCLKNNADYIIEMDADFSHNPKYIPLLLEKMKKYDVVLGSRFVKGGKQIGRQAIRMLITRIANLYIKAVLGLKVKDCNSGYRCFKKDVLKSINLDNIKSKGPDVVQEILYRCHLKNFRICEIPIVFRERRKGKTKLKPKHIFRSYIRIINLRFSKTKEMIKLKKEPKNQ